MVAQLNGELCGGYGNHIEAPAGEELDGVVGGGASGCTLRLPLAGSMSGAARPRSQGMTLVNTMRRGKVSQSWTQVARCMVAASLVAANGWSHTRNHVPLPTRASREWPQETWTLEPSPAVSIGVDVGAPEYLFYLVRSALLLPDGRIVVSDHGAKELRCFDARGYFLWSAGRRGQGPGEFNEHSTMKIFAAHAEDWILVDDGESGKVNIFNFEGTLVRSTRLIGAPNAPRVFLAGVFLDGSWLVLAPDRGGRVDPAIRAEAGRIFAHGQQYHRYSDAGEPISFLARTTGRRRMIHRVGDVTHHPYLPFAPTPQVAVFGDRLWVTSGADAEVVAHDMNGRVVARLRWDRDAAPLTRDMFERYRKSKLESMGEDTGLAYSMYRDFYAQDLPIPEGMPLYRAMLADSNGNLWLERFRPSLPDDPPPRWDVVDPDKGWVATIETLPRFSVYQIAGDSILGLHQDEEGVQRVRVYRIKR